jgi:hypothetical protein
MRLVQDKRLAPARPQRPASVVQSVLALLLA